MEFLTFTPQNLPITSFVEFLIVTLPSLPFLSLTLVDEVLTELCQDNLFCSVESNTHSQHDDIGTTREAKMDSQGETDPDLLTKSAFTVFSFEML